MLHNVSIVTVTWKDDPLAPQLQAFDRWIGGSQYWGLLAEYGVNLGTQAGTYVVPETAPPALDDADIAKLLTKGIAEGALPPVTPDRLYTVYPPTGTVVTEKQYGDVASCRDFQAFHSSTRTTTGERLVYAVIPRCPPANRSDLDFTTWGASHEIAEAATDPDSAAPAWTRASAGWTGDPIDPGAELADLCDGRPTRVEGYYVARLYSNRAAQADLRSCLPAPPGPAFGAFATPSTLALKSGEEAQVTITVWAAGRDSYLQLALLPSDPVISTPYASVESGKRVQNGEEVPVTIKLGATAMSGTTLTVTMFMSDAKDSAIFFIPIQVL